MVFRIVTLGNNSPFQKKKKGKKAREKEREKQRNKRKNTINLGNVLGTAPSPGEGGGGP